MSPKYRVLLAVLLSILAFYSQVVFGQTKVTTKIVHLDGNSIAVKLDNLINKDCSTGPGSITITTSGGTAPYTYHWSGPNNFSSSQEDLTNLQEGTYTLTTTDAKGCSLSRSWTIQSVCASTCSLDDVAIVNPVTSCGGSNGSIMITAITGGSGTYAYTWYDASFQIISNAKNLVSVQAGTYYVEVTDLNKPACSAFFYYTIESPFKLSATISPNTKCIVPFTGSVAASVSGGSGNYTYTWKYPNGTTINGTPTLSGLSSGNYQLQVKDNTSGCTIDKYFFVYNSAATALSISETITPATTCTPANGAIDITVTNGAGSFAYTWFNVDKGLAAGSTQDLTQASAGTYSIYVLDPVSQCSGFRQLTVPDLTTSPQYNTTVTSNTNCAPPFNGAIDLNITNAANYSVAWSSGNQTHQQEDISNLAPGKYGLTLKNKTTGCVTAISAESPQAIVVPDASTEGTTVTVDNIKKKSNCLTPDGSIQVSVQSNALYTLSWAGPNGFKSSQEDITGLDSGTYILTIATQCNGAPVIQKADVVTPINSTVMLNLLDIVYDPDNNLDPQSFAILEQPGSGAMASITNDNFLEIRYSNSFQGNDNLRLKACDMLNACSESSVTIKVAVETNIIVYNAIAPTSTGDNKYMRIDRLPEGNNRVSIFNRWGDKVFEIENYESEVPGKRFEGLSTSGSVLPTGTYFYKIELPPSQPTITGYLSLKQ